MHTVFEPFQIKLFLSPQAVSSILSMTNTNITVKHKDSGKTRTPFRYTLGYTHTHTKELHLPAEIVNVISSVHKSLQSQHAHLLGSPFWFSDEEGLPQLFYPLCTYKYYHKGIAPSLIAFIRQGPFLNLAWGWTQIS